MLVVFAATAVNVAAADSDTSTVIENTAFATVLAAADTAAEPSGTRTTTEVNTDAEDEVALLSRTLAPFAVVSTVVVDVPLTSAEPSGTLRADAVTAETTDTVAVADLIVPESPVLTVAEAETVASPRWMAEPKSLYVAADNGARPSIG